MNLKYEYIAHIYLLCLYNGPESLNIYRKWRREIWLYFLFVYRPIAD